MPTKEVIEAERAMIEEETEANKEAFQRSVIDQVESFDPTALKHVETEDRSSPDTNRVDYVVEKTHSLVRLLIFLCHYPPSSF